MKVCLVAPVSGWRGGMHQYSVQMTNSLAAKAKVEVVGYKRLFPLWLYPGTSKKLSGEIPLGKEIALHEVLKYYSVLSSFKAAKIIRKSIRPDVVDIQWIAPQHGFVLIPLMALLRCGSGAKILLTVHNVSPHEPRLFDRLLSRWAFKLSHRIVVHAEKMKGDIRSDFGDAAKKVAVIPHGICANGVIRCTRTQARNYLGIREKQVILFFGFVRPYKGLDQLIAAFKELARKFDVALVIAGEFFTGLDQCQKDLERSAISKRTYLFPRYIPYDEIPIFFGAADIVVQPYTRFSGQSGVTQTAYLYSLPVVATEVGGLPELVLHEKTGLIVEPGKPRELARALEKLLFDGAKREEYGANGKSFLEKHLSWEKVTQRLLEVYANA
jgi:glycosyltransferase involved in cell wall biosynthesis